MFIRLENIYSSELGKFWEMTDVSAQMNLRISYCFQKHMEKDNPARKQKVALSLKKF